MRILILFILTLGVVPALQAQENRSATELAKENITEYLTKKVFEGQQYSPVSFQSLQSYKAPHKSDIAWTIGHEFRIAPYSGNNKEKGSQIGFLFYLDKKMSILRAESYEVR